MATVPNRNLPPGKGASASQARQPAQGVTLKGVLRGGGVEQAPGGGGRSLSAAAAAQAAARLKASGGKPVGYGLQGNPFYNIEKYHQSKAFAQRQKAGRAGVIPPPPQAPRGMGNRLPGVSPNFPHVGAPAAAGTFDQHVEAAREAMLRATERGV